MKRIGQTLLVGLFALLLLLSCQALVEHPELPEEERTIPMPVHTALLCPDAAVPLQYHAAAVEDGQTVRRALLPQAETVLPGCMPVRDGNGIPLTGQSYVRTVYNVCRLEATSG